VSPFFTLFRRYEKYSVRIKQIHAGPQQ
jgi:hypothetical protein